MSTTPVCGEKKRDASSPLDAELVKKSRLGSTDDAEHPEKHSFSLSDEHISKIAEILKVTFSGQLAEIATTIVSGVMVGVNKAISDLQAENKELRDKVYNLRETG